MIRMTKQTDYGFVLLTRLAAEPGTAMNAPELSAETKLPLPMVSKILKLLVRQGLLASHRGVKGGYALARPAAEIHAGQAQPARPWPPLRHRVEHVQIVHPDDAPRLAQLGPGLAGALARLDPARRDPGSRIESH